MNSINIILAPYHAGIPNIRVGKGPDRLIADGLISALEGLAPVEITSISDVDEIEGEIGKSFELKRRIARAVRTAVQRRSFPIVLAGNCNSSVGVWAGVGDPKAGVIWFDAHPDFDTPEEHRSGYFDGMGVATLTGRCWQAMANSIEGFRPLNMDQLVYCGIRDSNQANAKPLSRLKYRRFTGPRQNRSIFVWGWPISYGRRPSSVRSFTWI